MKTSEHLYAIIDAEVAARPLDLALRALRSGCAALQLRAKHLDDRAFLSTAQRLAAMCRASRVPFIINDRPDIARIVAADGLHLGQDDMTVADARRVVGSLDIGVSTHSRTQAHQAEEDGADRIAFGPVFPTTSKTNPDPVVGLRELGEVCRAVDRPVVAIGGITRENASSVLDAGAAQIAVISALPTFVG